MTEPQVVQQDLPPEPVKAFGNVPSPMSPKVPQGPLSERAAAAGSLADPHSAETEQVVLGAVLTDAAAAAHVIATLSLGDFYLRSHQVVFTAVLELSGGGHPVSTVTVMHQLRSAGQLAAAGGPAYLQKLREARPLPGQATYLARILREYTAQRVVRAALITADSDLGEGVAAIDLAEKLRGLLDEVPHPYADDVTPMDELVTTLLDDLDRRSKEPKSATHPRRAQTGLVDVDEFIGGIDPGQLVLVAARPGQGKTTTAMTLARHAAIRQHLSVLVFNLEMTKSELVLGVMSAETRISNRILRDQPDELSEFDWSVMAGRVPDLVEARLFIDDQPDTTMADIWAKAEAVKRRHGLDLVIIDHIGLVNAPRDGRRNTTRQEVVAEFSRQAKILAKKLDVAVLVAAQLNRDLKGRADKRPQLTDLRETGQLEQDADKVLGLYRPDSDNPEHERTGEVDVIVLKNRSGPLGERTALFEGRFSRLVNLSRS